MDDTLKRPGGKKNPPVAAAAAEIEARVPPLANPCDSAVFEAAALENTLPLKLAKPPAACCVGARFPKILNPSNELYTGVFCDTLSAICPGNVSMKNPKPPRTTVFFSPNGVQAKPTRGCQAMVVNLGSAWFNPVTIDWL